jgi:hypothetical protein
VALALIVASVAVAAPRTPSAVPASERGWLTGAGIALAGVSVLMLSLAVHQALVLQDSNARLTGYLPSPVAVPTPTEAPDVNLFERRREDAQALVLPFAAASVVTALGALISIALDAPAPPRLSVAWTNQTATVNLAGSF